MLLKDMKANNERITVPMISKRKEKTHVIKLGNLLPPKMRELVHFPNFQKEVLTQSYFFFPFQKCTLSPSHRKSSELTLGLDQPCPQKCSSEKASKCQRSGQKKRPAPPTPSYSAVTHACEQELLLLTQTNLGHLWKEEDSPGFPTQLPRRINKSPFPNASKCCFRFLTRTSSIVSALKKSLIEEAAVLEFSGDLFVGLFRARVSLKVILFGPSSRVSSGRPPGLFA